MAIEDNTATKIIKVLPLILNPLTTESIKNTRVINPIRIIKLIQVPPQHVLYVGVPYNAPYGNLGIHDHSIEIHPYPSTSYPSY
jgi:hypothetical protein